MSELSRKLCVEIEKHNEIIIYGFSVIGINLLDYLIDLDTDIRIANYSGKVKYFAGSFIQEESVRKEIRGIKIRNIRALTEHNERALVIVAMQEKNHKDVRPILEELQYKHVIYLNHGDVVELRESIENHTNLVNVTLQQYHLNHNIKLDRVRRKVAAGKKVKVFFMCHEAAAFGCASVYKEMMNNTLFDPYVFVVSRRDVGGANYMEEVTRDIAFFENNGYKVISGYDENGNPKDLHFLRPDIIFYDLPKMHDKAGNYFYRLDHINWEYLTIYIPYGLMMVDSFYYHYHTKCIRESWRFAIDTTSNYKRAIADTSFNGYNLINSGYAKFDDYCLEESSIPEKINNGNPIVIYAPHHSLGVSNNFATFDLHYKTIMEFVEKHPEINFVYKPHPLLEYQIAARYKNGSIAVSPEEYAAYVDKWNHLENGIVYTSGEYISLFRKSACMITDCGSFIGEYLPSLNPCIYIFNPRKKRQMEVYTAAAQNILDTYYIVNTKEELLMQLEEIIVNGNDEKANRRAKTLQEEFGELGGAGKRIVDYLATEVSDY